MLHNEVKKVEIKGGCNRALSFNGRVTKYGGFNCLYMSMNKKFGINSANLSFWLSLAIYSFLDLKKSKFFNQTYFYKQSYI